MVFHQFNSDNSDNSLSSEDVFTFLDRFPGGLFRYRNDSEGRLDFVSGGLVELFGCSSLEQFKELTGSTFEGLVHPDDVERVQASIKEQIESKSTDRVHFRIIRADGEVRWVDDRGHLVKDSNGIEWFYVTLMDITERVQERDQLKRANERLEILTALSNDVVFDIECMTGKADVYGDFEGRFGREPRQSDFVVHRRCQKECHLSIDSHDLSHLLDQITENSLVDFETSSVDDDGNAVWYRYQSVVQYDENGNPTRHVGRLLDTHEQAIRESSFRKKAERDPLTGIYNRAAALDRIETTLNSDTRPCMLIAIDVDDFKGVNDTYGHLEGDRVLKELADFLSNVMRKEDIVARIGGDEFLIFAAGLEPGPAADRVLEHLSRGPFAAQRATDISGDAKSDKDAQRDESVDHASPTLSIGAACCMEPPVAFEDLYAAADSALYEAKNNGKGCYQFSVTQF